MPAAEPLAASEGIFEGPGVKGIGKDVVEGASRKPSSSTVPQAQLVVGNLQDLVNWVVAGELKVPHFAQQDGSLGIADNLLSSRPCHQLVDVAQRRRTR